MFTLYNALLLYLQMIWPSYFLLMSFIRIVCQSVLLVTVTRISYLGFKNSLSAPFNINIILVLLIMLKRLANLNASIAVLNSFNAGRFLRIKGIRYTSCLYISLPLT